MNSPHKHVDVIKAWADGKEIQFRVKGNSDEDWIAVYQTAILDFNDERLEWRIKPEISYKKLNDQLMISFLDMLNNNSELLDQFVNSPEFVDIITQTAKDWAEIKQYELEN